MADIAPIRADFVRWQESPQSEPLGMGARSLIASSPVNHRGGKEWIGIRATGRGSVMLDAN